MRRAAGAKNGAQRTRPSANQASVLQAKKGTRAKRSISLQLKKIYKLDRLPFAQVNPAVASEEQPLTASEAEGKDRERISARAKLCYQDGRGLGELSSGQQSQTAVAMLVAQNLQVAQAEPPLDRGMPHPVFLLDDVSSSYDLTNLVRESILWRQLAYTTDPIQKRQVFISSHHEDLTNLLVDQLGPPQGYRMKVLRFVDWTWEKGPIVECFDVEPSHRHDDPAGIEAFQSAIGAMFHGA